MPSENLSIERILPNKWHVAIDMGPPTYQHRIVDVSTLAEAVAEITAAAATIEPTAKADVSAVHVADVAVTAPAPETAEHEE